jgi:hypothetical protein
MGRSPSKLRVNSAAPLRREPQDAGLKAQRYGARMQLHSEEHRQECLSTARRRTALLLRGI